MQACNYAVALLAQKLQTRIDHVARLTSIWTYWALVQRAFGAEEGEGEALTQHTHGRLLVKAVVTSSCSSYVAGAKQSIRLVAWLKMLESLPSQYVLAGGSCL